MACLRARMQRITLKSHKSYYDRVAEIMLGIKFVRNEKREKDENNETRKGDSQRNQESTTTRAHEEEET